MHKIYDERTFEPRRTEFILINKQPTAYSFQLCVCPLKKSIKNAIILKIVYTEFNILHVLNEKLQNVRQRHATWSSLSLTRTWVVDKMTRNVHSSDLFEIAIATSETRLHKIIRDQSRDRDLKVLDRDS